jgi:hypothetical protein
MTISPDGRKILFINRITLTALVQECALDNGDGLVNEDKLDDLDNDGNIVMMRRKAKTGRWKVDP